MYKVLQVLWFFTISTFAATKYSLACQGVRYTRQQDRRLEGHVIKTLVLDESSCLLQCKMIVNCFSINIYKGRNHSWQCDLNSSNKQSSQDDFAARVDYTYFEIKVIWLYTSVAKNTGRFVCSFGVFFSECSFIHIICVK